MAKFNEKKEGVKPTVKNFMNEDAYQLSPKEELISTLMTTFLEDTYYESAETVVKRISEIVKDVDPKFVAKLAIYARNEGKLRSVTHFLAAIIAPYVSMTDWGKKFYEKIIVRPDDMSEILSAYAKLNGMKLKELKAIPNSIKKGFKAALEKLDAYQIDKYKMNGRSISLVDLVRLFHPKGNEKNEEAFRRLIKGESLSDLYTSKVLEKELTKAGQATQDASQLEKDEAKREAIISVLENINGMPIMNLLRNLRNILIYAPEKVEEACKQLTIEQKVINSRLLPFRFATAYKEIESTPYPENKSTSEIAFESENIGFNKFLSLKKNILDAIETALEISCQNIPELEGNVAILCDDSGSMRGDDFNSSRVSSFSKTTTSTIGHLFASMVAWKQHDVYVGLFGDKLIQVPYNRDNKLLDFVNQMDETGGLCGGATESGIYDFLSKVVEENKKIDNVIVFSDCQIGKGDGYGFTGWFGLNPSETSLSFHVLFKKFRKINPTANFIVVNLRQSGGTSVFDRSQRIINIAGWSEKIFDIISVNTKTKGWDEIIRKIEEIEL